MSVIGRLWRRAPAWRLLLFVAVATSGLCAMFPPHLPSSLLLPPDLASGSHYTPQPDAPASNESTLSMPPITGLRQTLIPFAGRQLPLPAGEWSELALIREPPRQDVPAQQALVLARLQSGRMTGMIIAAGTSLIMPHAPIPQAPCIDPTGLPVHDMSDRSLTDPALRECWWLRRLDTADLVNSRNPLESSGFARLGKLDVAVPSHLLGTHYIRSDDHGLLSVTILLPDPTQSDGLRRRVEAWAARWVPLLHRGFEGDLTPQSVTTALARDPQS